MLCCPPLLLPTLPTIALTTPVSSIVVAVLSGLVGLVLGWWLRTDWGTRATESARSLPEKSPKPQQPFDFAPIGMAELALDGTVLRANPALCALLGEAAADLLHTPLYPWVHPKDQARLQHQLTQLVSCRSPITELEQRCVRQNQQLIYTIWDAHLLQDAQGQPCGIFVAIQDISARRQSELALQEQQQYLRLIIDNIPQQVFWKDTNSIFLGCNKNWAMAAGLDDPEDVVGKTDFDLLPDATIAEHYRMQDRVIIETNQPELHTIASKERPDADGQVVWLDINRVPIHDPLGEVVGILGVLEDITQRRLAEEAIRENEALLDATFHQAAIGIAHQDRQGACLKVNQRYCDIFGYTNRQMQQVRFQQLSHPADLDPDKSQYQALWSGELETYTLEKRCIRQDGTVIWCSKTVSLTYDAQGVPRYATVILEDISDRVQADIESQKAKESAEQANRAKSDFLAKMSHELRTPLNVILGFTQLLQRQINLTPSQQEHLSTINRSGEHLLMLINDVLDLSKIEARRIPINNTPMDLDQFLDRLQDMLQLKANAQGLQLKIARSPQINPYISVDEGKLRQVLINLLGNALKFTFRGEVCLDITPTRTEHGEALHFEVRDTGVGIADHECAKLFEPFEQTVSGEAMGQGTGLGLAIAQQFVRLMGGEITVTSVVGQGSTFEFTLPVQAAPVQTLDAPTPTPQVLHLAPNQPNYRLLIVDDSVEHCRVLSELLLDVGFEVKVATGGHSALQLWESFTPHLVWMDAQMPDLDGYEVTRRMRSRELAEHRTPTKIIALTARVFEADRALALASGCDDFVRKPFEEAAIFTTLAEHLNVEYCYVEPNVATVSHLPDSDASLIIAYSQEQQFQSMVQQMPDQWQADLLGAAQCCDHSLVLPLLQAMPAPSRPLQKYLLQCLNHYRFDYIVDLFAKSGQASLLS